MQGITVYNSFGYCAIYLCHQRWCKVGVCVWGGGVRTLDPLLCISWFPGYNVTDDYMKPYETPGVEFCEYNDVIHAYEGLITVNTGSGK